MTAIFLTSALMLGGCGTAVPAAEELEEVQEETVEEEEAEAETEPEIKVEEEAETEETEEEPPVYEEDKNIYGNTIGNIYNDGALIYNEEDGCLYFQNLYSGRLVKTVPETGHTINLSDELSAMYNLNLYDEKLYGVEITSENELGAVCVYDLRSGDVESLREDSVDYLQVVDGTLYFTDLGDNTLRKMDAESKEETVLVNEPVYCPAVYKDIIVFQLDSDKESLYSISRDGGEITKLNDVRSYDPIVYRDRIYYKAVDSDKQYTLRSMDLDGNDEEILLSEDIFSMNLYEGLLYYVPEDAPDNICYIDLSDETRKVQSLELGDIIRSALKSAYGTSEVQIVSYAPMVFSGGYMLFMNGMKIEGQEYIDEFLYKMDTEELFIIPVYCKDKESDTVKQENAKQETESNETATDAKQIANPEATAPESIPASAAPIDGIVPIKNLANYSSLKKKMTDAEFQAAYNEALKIVQPLVGLSPEEQAKGIYSALRAMADNGTVSYSEEAPHYNDAYGYLINHAASCAGSARTTGLCLNMLGMSYEHVNENQWDHQWCRVNINGVIWIVDPYGMVCAPETAPYAHPML